MQWELKKEAAKGRDRLLKHVLVKYGLKVVLEEYRSMSPNTRKVMIEALDAMISNCMMMRVANRAHNLKNNLQARNHSATISDADCPIVLLMRHQTKSEPDKELIDTIKGRVGSWGGQGLLLWNPFFLSMRDLKVEKEYQDLKKREAGKRDDVELSNSTVLATKTGGSSAFNHNDLVPITIKDLKLFESCRGSVLRGTIISLPAVITGITTFLRDDVGDIIQLGVYNFVPGKMGRLSANEYVRAHLPKETRVEIVEPFTKIFVDGNRGIRIDDPREFRVKGDRSRDLDAARQEGNEFYKKKMFFASSESYISGLRGETFVPTVLSNRAQAFIICEQWGAALADAAASLTIRPSCQKTKLRYRKALEILQGQHETKSLPLRETLFDSDWPISSSDTTTPKTPEELKTSGNNAFKIGQYKLAIELYTKCLLESGGDIRAVLSNWSQSSIELECYHEALAASAASLRIWSDDKAIFRLCKSLTYISECNLAEDILRRRGGSAVALKDLEGEIIYLKTHILHPLAGHHLQKLRVPDLCPDWASENIETFFDPNKGRGVRATDDLFLGQAIMIQAPLISAGADIKKDKIVGYSLGKNRTMSDTSHMLLQSVTMNCLKRDQLLAQRMDMLSDGKSPRPLIKLPELLNSVTVAGAPFLLPPHVDYFESKAPDLTPERVRDIIFTNAFGSFEAKECLSKKDSLVYSAISMFNHSNRPNCTIFPYSGSSRILVTSQSIKSGKELTISYHSDPEVLERKWGIKE